MKKIKIAIIEPVGGHGGMDYYDYGLSLGLGNNNCEVFLFTCDKTPLKIYDNVNVYFTFNKLWNYSNKYLKLFYFFLGFFNSLFIIKKKKIKIIHFHLFHLDTIFLIQVFISKILFLKLVVTVHDVESFNGRENNLFVERLFYKLVDKVIVHNKFSFNEIIKKTELKKISIIPHGNYIPFLKKVESLSLAKNDKLNILFFGQIKKVKGLDVLLNALPILVQKKVKFRLIIAGKIWKDDFLYYQSIIQKNNLEFYIDLRLRYISDEDVYALFNKASLIVLPYKKIYQSGVLLMAMSFGRIVLASDLPAFTEIIEDERNGYLFKTEDYNSLAKRLIEISNNRNKLPSIEKQAYEYVRENYDWNRIGKLTLKAYEEIA